MIHQNANFEHLIVGSGNLALSLREELEAVTSSITQVPFDIVDAWRTNDFPSLRGAGTIWFCTGGRHAEAKAHPNRSHRHNVDLPRIVMDRSDAGTKLVFFSTADCAHPDYPSRPDMRTPAPLNEFATQKLQLEGTIIAANRPLTACVRLSTLFSSKKPLSTMPGRLLRADWGDIALSFPANEVTPTPAEWAAVSLILSTETNLWRDDRPTIHHLSPIGSISAHDWAKLILGGGRKYVERRHFDATRPRQHALGTTLHVATDHWSTLWPLYFKREQYQ